MKSLYSRFVARVVDGIIARAKRTPYTHLPGYMERYWLVQPSRWTFGLGVRVHHILRSDLDRDMHTHPWWSISVILRGVYWEVMPAPAPDAPGALVGGYANLNEPFFCFQRKPGHITFRRRTARHKLMLFRGPVWSLFIHGRDHGAWGYHVPGVGLIDRRDYRGDKP